jgi:DNA-binding transcriptional regulator GbsR (MarR family)
VLREVIQQEFLRVISQLHTDLRKQLRDQQEHLRDDLHQEEAAIIAEMKARERRSDDRLA